MSETHAPRHSTSLHYVSATPMPPRAWPRDRASRRRDSLSAIPAPPRSTAATSAIPHDLLPPIAVIAASRESTLHATHLPSGLAPARLCSWSVVARRSTRPRLQPRLRVPLHGLSIRSFSPGGGCRL